MDPPTRHKIRSILETKVNRLEPSRHFGADAPARPWTSSASAGQAWKLHRLWPPTRQPLKLRAATKAHNGRSSLALGGSGQSRRRCRQLNGRRRPCSLLSMFATTSANANAATATATSAIEERLTADLDWGVPGRTYSGIKIKPGKGIHLSTLNFDDEPEAFYGTCSSFLAICQVGCALVKPFTFSSPPDLKGHKLDGIKHSKLTKLKKF